MVSAIKNKVPPLMANRSSTKQMPPSIHYNRYSIIRIHKLAYLAINPLASEMNGTLWDRVPPIVMSRMSLGGVLMVAPKPQ